MPYPSSILFYHILKKYEVKTLGKEKRPKPFS